MTKQPLLRKDNLHNVLILVLWNPVHPDTSSRDFGILTSYLKNTRFLVSRNDHNNRMISAPKGCYNYSPARINVPISPEGVTQL